MFRDGRGYSIGRGYTNYGGRATGSATINGDVIQAYGSASSNDQLPLNRNYGFGEVFPGQAIAKAEIYDTPQNPVYGSAKAEAEAQNAPTFYAIPAPASIVSYEQNFEVPAEIRYTIPVNGGLSAESSAVINGNSESSITSAKSDATGSVESSAKSHGVGNYIVSSNAKTTDGSGSAYSDANNVHGLSNTVTKTNGFGSASSKSQNELGLTLAESQSNGGSASSMAKNTVDSIIASANTQGFGSASSNVNANNFQGDAVIAAKSPVTKGIHWRFGTAYGTPSDIYGQATSQSNGGSAKSTAQTNAFGTIQSSADTQGYGSANSNANLNGIGYVNSVANNGNGFGSAKSSANSGYGTVNTIANSNGFGNAKSSANIQGPGFGNADARSDINNIGYGTMTSSAQSNGFGSASSSANNGLGYGALKYSGFYGGSQTNAQTNGQGTASSSIRSPGVNAAYRLVNSSANSFGYGSAQANASA